MKHALAILCALGLSLWGGEARAACACSFGDGAYTTGSAMTIDGTFTDWNAVLADTDNNACDAIDGAGDPDSATINNGGRDLVWFAQTWDPTYVYLFTERVAGNAAQQQFLYYADLDSDGFMETGEYVINAQWSNSGVSLLRYTYTASVGGGDPMTNGSGSADGYTLQGTLGSSTTVATATAASNGSTRLEFRFPWTGFGVASGTGITFHVSTVSGAINAGSPPGSVNDNMSGCGGGLGGTKFASFTFTPNRSVSGQHSATTCAAHAIQNTANADDIFNITVGALPTQVASVSLYSDNDASGTLTVGDALLTDSADSGTVVDTGTVAVLGVKNILACYTIAFTNSYTPSGSGNVTLTASSAWNSSVNHSVVDTVTVTLVADPLLVKSSVPYWDPVSLSVNPKRLPGSVVTFSVSLSNQGGRAIDTDTVVITDAIPTNLDLVVTDIGVLGSGPVSQANGAVACGLTYTFTSLASTTDDVEFSKSNGATWDQLTDIPTANGNGVDPAVTHLRIRPKGVFVGQSSATPPSCVWSFRARVE